MWASYHWRLKPCHQNDRRRWQNERQTRVRSVRYLILMTPSPPANGSSSRAPSAPWHRLITRATQRHYPDAAVTLAEIEKTAGLLFRAFGGDPGLRIAPAATLAGTHRRIGRKGRTDLSRCRNPAITGTTGPVATPGIEPRPLSRLSIDAFIAPSATGAVIEQD